MKSNKLLIVFLLIIVNSLTSCKPSSSGSSGSSTPVSPTITGNNVMSVSVNGSGCAAGSYANKPCVSVKICAPGSTTNCQTVSDILLDTGSYGFRVFKSVLNAGLASALTPITVSGKTLAQCVQFGDGSADWGPVVNANLILASEPAVQVPIQLIDASFSSISSSDCPSPEASPAVAGLNGILGIGTFPEDCGATCVTTDVGLYFACDSTSCTGSTASIANQLKNPIAWLPQDNNGYILNFPSVPLGGNTDSITGQLILGIGTQSNNSTPSGLSIIPTNNNGDFYTSFNGVSKSSFIDTGSNALYFPANGQASLLTCASYPSFYCPTTTINLVATITGYSGNPSKSVSFYVGNLDDFGSGSVFLEFAGKTTTYFDWGLPFYFGKKIYSGISGKSTSLGNGPYWAY